MKTDRRQKLGTLIALLAVCLTVQTIQQVYHSRWSARWGHLFEKANRIQTSIDALESSGATKEQIVTQRRALGETLSEIKRTFRPDLIPKCLQACAGLGTFGPPGSDRDNRH